MGCFWGKSTVVSVAAPIRSNPIQSGSLRTHVHMGGRREQPAGSVSGTLVGDGGAAANSGGARGAEIGFSSLRVRPGEETAHAPVN